MTLHSSSEKSNNFRNKSYFSFTNFENIALRFFFCPEEQNFLYLEIENCYLKKKNTQKRQGISAANNFE